MTSDSLQGKYGREFKSGHSLFREGDSGKEMYVILSGKVTISKKVRGQEQVLVTLPPGEFFGEMSILDNKPRSASASVAEDCKLLVIDPKTFEEMIKNNGEIAIRMIRKLAERLRAADSQIENLMLKDNNSRIVHLLTSSAESSGTKVDGGIRLPFTKQEIAQRIGCEDLAPVEAMLSRLVKAKIVTLEPNSLVISDTNQLRKFLEFLAMKEQFGELA